ncbi:MAG: tetratricopeptide repeat protein [Sedimenticola sp.]
MQRTTCKLSRTGKLFSACIITGLLSTSQASLADNLEKGFMAFNAGSYASAIEYLTPVAENNDPQAQYLLSVVYQSQRGPHGDEYRSFEWCHRAAQQGHAEAQFQLGMMYLNGIGVTEDDSDALEWIGRAADNKHPRAVMLYDYLLNNDFSEGC